MVSQVLLEAPYEGAYKGLLGCHQGLEGPRIGCAWNRLKGRCSPDAPQKGSLHLSFRALGFIQEMPSRHFVL